MANAEEVEGLDQATASRDVIATARGMLMARSGIDEDAAFGILRRASPRMDDTLREVARRLVDGEPLSGPGDPPA